MEELQSPATLTAPPEGIGADAGNSGGMSTPSAPPPPPTQAYGRPYYGAMPPMPALNGELIVFILAWVVIFIITLAADTVDWPAFVTATIALSVGYMLSRGIAKASRVYENH